MIKYIVAYNRISELYEVVRMPIGEGWIGEVIYQVATLGEAQEYAAELRTLFGLKQ